MYAVLQTHCAAEQMELVRLGSAVLWRMHHSRSPPTAAPYIKYRYSPPLGWGLRPLRLSPRILEVGHYLKVGGL